MNSSTEHSRQMGLPWYAISIIGVLLTPFMAWLLVARSAYYAGKQQLGAAILIIEISVGIAIAFAGTVLPIEWWRLDLGILIFNIICSLGAGIFQHVMIGPEFRIRLFAAPWRRMIAPLFCSAIFGYCAMVTLSIPAMIGEQSRLMQSMDVLDRSSILIDFLRKGMSGIPYGLFAGIWWCARADRFGMRAIIASILGSVMTFSATAVFLLGFIFVQHGGAFSAFSHSVWWSCYPPWISGMPFWIKQTEDVLSLLGMLAAGLLFGAPESLAAFWKRASLPLAVVLCMLPYWNTDSDVARMVLDQMDYDMAHENPGARAATHRRIETFLLRYPQSGQWFRLAAEHADYLYDNGKYPQARSWWQRIACHGSTSRDWWYTQRAQTILARTDFGVSADTAHLDMPMVDYESYFDDGWMTLTTLIHYWEHDKVPESKTKLRLKKLSNTEDGIRLKKIASLMDIDDAARSLGYRMAIVPACSLYVKSLVRHGLPVLYPAISSMDIAWGFDGGRSALQVYRFSRLSTRLKNQARKEADVIMSHAEEGKGRNAGRLRHIALECRYDRDLSMLESDAGRYMDPLCAVMYPADRCSTVSAALNMDSAAIARLSNGYRATVMSLECFDHLLLREAVDWARRGSALINDPLPRYAGALAFDAWEYRRYIALSTLPLSRAFAPLASLDSFFAAAPQRAFRDSCVRVFSDARAGGSAPQMMVWRYYSTIETSSAGDRRAGIACAQKELAVNPTYVQRWKWLISASEWEKNDSLIFSAFRGYLSAMPYDYPMKVRLAFEYVKRNRPGAADSVLREVVADSVNFNADYYFCLGAIAEWKKKTGDALAYYRKCTMMRRYKPEYYYRYAALLKSMGKDKEATRAREWADRLRIE